MKLLELLKKHKTKSITKEIIALSSLACVPTKDYFKDNNQFLDLINYQKNKYLDILIKEKVLTSKAIKSAELYNKMNMLHSLIEQNTLDDELFEKVIYDEEDKVKALIKIRKFAIYNEKIKELEEEVISRIIALKEILNKTFLNRQKRISIINEINNLTNVFVILMNQKEALSLCLNNYSVKCFAIVKEIKEEKEKKIIRLQVEELKKYEELTGIEKIEINSLVDIAKVEVALEEYVYENKDNVKKLKKELININSIEKIEELEEKYKIYYEFGKRLVTKEELKDLYKIKFKILTNGLIGTIQPFILYRNVEKQELEVYKEIISQKINDLLKGDNLYLKETFKKDYSKALLEITKKLKIRNEYNPESILRNRYQLNLLLATEVASGIPLFLENYKINANNYEDLQMYRSIFDWEDELPLETIYRFEKINKVKNRSLLYDLYVKNNSIFKENYYLFKGIKNVKTFYSITTDHLLKVIQKEATGKIVIMPNSLKKYDYNLFKNTIIKGIIFPEGVSELGYKVLASNHLPYVSLPSTITSINSSIFEYNQIIDAIIFNNFRNSNILQDKQLLLTLLKGFIDAIIIRNINNNYTFKNILKFDRLIFFDGDKIIEIPSENLECEYVAEKASYDFTIKRIQELAQEMLEVQDKEEKLTLAKKF